MKFSIRDLLWLTLVVGLYGGWWVDHANLTLRAARLTSEVERTRLEVSKLAEASRDQRESGWHVLRWEAALNNVLEQENALLKQENAGLAQAKEKFRKTLLEAFYRE